MRGRDACDGSAAPSPLHSIQLPSLAPDGVRRPLHLLQDSSRGVYAGPFAHSQATQSHSAARQVLCKGPLGGEHPLIRHHHGLGMQAQTPGLESSRGVGNSASYNATFSPVFSTPLPSGPTHGDPLPFLAPRTSPALPQAKEPQITS